MKQAMRFTQKVSGLLLLDKRLGVSSNSALQEVKTVFRARKAGHTGSLDPLASGLLPICLGEATKIAAYLLNTDKRYRVKIKLGMATETGDGEGEIIRRMPVPRTDEKVLLAVLDKFRGEISQVPPMFSAVKHNGVRLYELARKGVEVERESRRVTICDLLLIEHGKDWLDLEVACSKGTYIRVLAEDIGIALGCCGFVEQLRRTHVGDFRIEDALTIEDLRRLLDLGRLNGSLISINDALRSWPSVCLPDKLAFSLKQGQTVFSPKAPNVRWVKLCSQDKRLFGIGEVGDNGQIAPKRLIMESGAG